MSELSGHCEDELCLNESNHKSIRVFPCLYHCKKMLCIKHLSEHDQLEYLWKDYSLSFNEEKIQKEFQKLKTKLENYQQLSKEIRHLLLIKNFNDSIENNQKLQTAIETVKKAIEQEDQLESIIGMLVYSK